MTLWWIGNVLLLVAVIPVLVALLNRVLAATAQMQLAKGITLCLALFISMAGTTIG